MSRIRKSIHPDDAIHYEKMGLKKLPFLMLHNEEMVEIYGKTILDALVELKKEGMGKAKSNFGKRAVVALIIFLAPTIVSILLTLVDGANINNCLNSNDIGNL